MLRPDKDWAEGDNYLVQWSELGMALEFSRIRESESAIRCLVTPVAVRDDGNRKRMLAPIWTNLFTLADRTRVAQAIAECIEGEGSPSLKEWKEGVERAFSRCIDWRSAPEPTIDLSQVVAPPDSGHLVWPLLARNEVNILLADQKSGKSYISLLIAVLAAIGRPDFAPPPLRLLTNEPMEVMYFDSETNHITQRRRLERICAALRLPQIPRIHYRRVKPPFHEHIAEHRTECARLGIELAIIDSLTFASGGDLNSTETGSLTMNAVGDLGETITKLATAHHAKQKGEPQPGAQVSVIGSSLYEFKARNIWVVQRHAVPNAPYIEQAWTHKWANDDRTQAGFGMRLDFNESNTAVQFSALDAASSSWIAARAGSHEDRIQAALMETDLWKATTEEIAKYTGLDNREVARVCKRMSNIRMLGGGRGRGNVASWELLAATGTTGTANVADSVNVAPIREKSHATFSPNGEKWRSGGEPHLEMLHATFPEEPGAEEEYPF